MGQNKIPGRPVLPGSFLFLVLSGEGEVSPWELEVLNHIPFLGLEIIKSNGKWICRYQENGVEQRFEVGKSLITPNLGLGFSGCLAVYYRDDEGHMEKLIQDVVRTAAFLEGKPLEIIQEKERDIQRLVSSVYDSEDKLFIIQQLVQEAVELTKNFRG